MGQDKSAKILVTGRGVSGAELARAHQEASTHVIDAPTAKNVLNAQITHATIAMAILQAHSKYEGAIEYLAKCPEAEVRRVRNALLGKGYIQRNFGNRDQPYKLSSLGEEALAAAMKGMDCK